MSELEPRTNPPASESKMRCCELCDLDAPVGWLAEAKTTWPPTIEVIRVMTSFGGGGTLIIVRLLFVKKIYLKVLYF